MIPYSTSPTFNSYARGSITVRQATYYIKRQNELQKTELNRINSFYPINTRNHSPLFQCAWKKHQIPKVQVAAAVESLMTFTFVLQFKF